MSNSVTILKDTKKGDLVIIPHKEYEEFSRWKNSKKLFKPFISTATEKLALKKAREDYKKGKYITIDELKRKS